MDPKFEGYNFIIRFRVLFKGNKFVVVAPDKLIVNGHEHEIEQLEPVTTSTRWHFGSYTGSPVIHRNTAIVVRIILLDDSIRKLLVSGNYVVRTTTGQFVISGYRLEEKTGERR